MLLKVLILKTIAENVDDESEEEDGNEDEDNMVAVRMKKSIFLKAFGIYF